MDYKNKYEQALEKARIWKDKSGMPKDKQGILDDIFPELKESEDERIVKELLTFFRESIHGGHILTNKEYDSWIAWLKKQGEQKSYWKPTKEQYEALDYAYNSCSDTERGNYYESVLETLIEDLHRLEEQGEQKYIPKYKIGDYVKNTNYKGEPIYEIVYMDKECYICEYRGKERMGDKAVMHFSFDNPYLRLVQKPAEWSEEDEKMINKLIAVIELYYGIGNDSEKEKCLSWLKSLKDRVQPKQEWNEEDSYMLKQAIKCVNNSGKLEVSTEEIENWLKSLRPQKQWKPSDEQMDALLKLEEMHVLEHENNQENAHLYMVVKSLREQLLKLREE